MYRLFVAAILVLLFTQCGEKYIFSQSNTLPDFGWTWANVQQFDLQLSDTTQRYDILLDITHTSDFPYENIYLKIGTQMPDGKKLSKPLNIYLADKLGAWQGKCSRNTCTTPIMLQENTYFNQAGQYQFSFEQYMRQDTLPHIRAIALKVRPHIAQAGK